MKRYFTRRDFFILTGITAAGTILSGCGSLGEKQLAKIPPVDKAVFSTSTNTPEMTSTPIPTWTPIETEAPTETATVAPTATETVEPTKEKVEIKMGVPEKFEDIQSVSWEDWKNYYYEDLVKAEKEYVAENEWSENSNFGFGSFVPNKNQAFKKSTVDCMAREMKIIAEVKITNGERKAYVLGVPITARGQHRILNFVLDPDQLNRLGGGFTWENFEKVAVGGFPGDVSLSLITKYQPELEKNSGGTLGLEMVKYHYGDFDFSKGYSKDNNIEMLSDGQILVAKQIAGITDVH